MSPSSSQESKESTCRVLHIVLPRHLYRPTPQAANSVQQILKFDLFLVPLHGRGGHIWTTSPPPKLYFSDDFSARIECVFIHGTFAFRGEAMARRFELGPYDPMGGGNHGGRPPSMYHDSLPRRFHHNQRVPQQQQLHQQVSRSRIR